MPMYYIEVREKGHISMYGFDTFEEVKKYYDEVTTSINIYATIYQRDSGKYKPLRMEEEI